MGHFKTRASRYTWRAPSRTVHSFPMRGRNKLAKRNERPIAWNCKISFRQTPQKPHQHSSTGQRVARSTQTWKAKVRYLLSVTYRHVGELENVVLPSCTGLISTVRHETVTRVAKFTNHKRDSIYLPLPKPTHLENSIKGERRTETNLQIFLYSRRKQPSTTHIPILRIMLSYLIRLADFEQIQAASVPLCHHTTQTLQLCLHVGIRRIRVQFLCALTCLCVFLNTAVVRRTVSTDVRHSGNKAGGNKPLLALAAKANSPSEPTFGNVTTPPRWFAKTTGWLGPSFVNLNGAFEFTKRHTSFIKCRNLPLASPLRTNRSGVADCRALRP